MPKKRKPGRPSQALTRADIVALAGPVFALRGHDGVSLREVAELAGIRKASLFHHFENKQALYTAVLDDALGSMAAFIAAAGLDEGDFLERLDRLGGALTEYFTAHRETARLMVRELIGNGPYLASEGGARVTAVLDLTAAFLSAGMEAGAFRKTDPKQLAVSIAGLHLLAFAAPEASERFLGAPLKELGVHRREAVLQQVRALCLGRP